eukprot:scaffold4557_cov74-Cyclotella_meneghiniana.AAC.3
MKLMPLVIAKYLISGSTKFFQQGLRQLHVWYHNGWCKEYGIGPWVLQSPAGFATRNLPDTRYPGKMPSGTGI